MVRGERSEGRREVAEPPALAAATQQLHSVVQLGQPQPRGRKSTLTLRRTGRRSRSS